MRKILVCLLFVTALLFFTLSEASEMTHFKVAMVQMTPVHLEKKANIDKMIGFVKEAASQGAKLIIFPELITTGYVGCYSPPEYNGFYEASEPIPGPTTIRFQKMAEERGVYIVFGMPERGESQFASVMYNTAAIVGPKGLIDCHRKVHLPLGEKTFFLPGDEIKVFRTELGRISLFVCYDLWFPEIHRIAGLKGANIMIDVTNWPEFDMDAWFALGSGLAASQMVWYMGVNRVAGENYWPGAGGSILVNPSGKILAKGENKEGIVYGDIDMTEVMKRRTLPPTWFDRRPDLYESLLKGTESK